MMKTPQTRSQDYRLTTLARRTVFPLFLGIVSLDLVGQGSDVHVWEKVELTFQAQNQYANPYTDVEVWVDLQGPGFNKRCFGFWDGGAAFRVRLLANRPGNWTWRTGASKPDAGLNDRRGSFHAIAWTDAEKAAVPTRRGFVQPTANGHAFEFVDGTPFLLLADTWWAAATDRFQWRDDDILRPLGPAAGFKDYVRLRQAQGFNGIALIVAFPNWADDGFPWEIWLDRPANLGIRSAWVNQADLSSGKPRGQWRAKNMINAGGRAFQFPGKVPGFETVYPDVERLNPDYFKELDRKIDYLNAQGFVPFMEVVRRDALAAWAKYYPWPKSYQRYLQYVWSRYQANNGLFSPVHYDWVDMTATTRQLNTAINGVIDAYGHPPFGTLVSCNSSISSLVNFGGPDENHWLTFHQIGNRREHDYYWYLTEIFHSNPSRPALNGEPYYSGMADKRYTPYAFGAPGGSELDDAYVRSGLYGSFLSGGFGGHIYGAEGIWGADVEPGSNPFMWEAFQWNSANQVQHLRTFALSEGKRYRELAPDADLITPNRTQAVRAYTGWAYCARTPARDFFLVYFEKDGAHQSVVRGARPDARYEGAWFDPRTGAWLPSAPLKADQWGRIAVPNPPSPADWGLKLVIR